MYIERLRISNFRNFSFLQTEFSKEINTLHGSNGSGKTNLLEAIFVSCLGRSQRAASDATMVRHGETVYRIEAEIGELGAEHALAVAYQLGDRKRITIDGLAVRITELYDSFCVVSAGPEDSAILSGAPARRRRFLDLYLSQLSRSYLTYLSDYSRTLAQKNAALKAEMDPEPFNALLIQNGSKVIAARHTFLKELQTIASGYYGDISNGSQFTLTYRPSIGQPDSPGDYESIQCTFKQRLLELTNRERLVKTALVGPHRDEIAFDISGYSARTCGSQGECRTAAIALKLAVYHLLKEHRRVIPILLLDEVFAELDPKRSDGVLRALGKFGQLFLTTAVESLPALRENSRNFRMAGGTVEAVS